MARKREPAPQPSLLSAVAMRTRDGTSAAPLADRMRPRSLDEVVGQEHLLRDGRMLGDAIRADRVPSLILWGPPGSGKTTLAHVIARWCSVVWRSSGI